MQQNRVVSRDEWVAARKALLAMEKEATHLRDRINAARLVLPWVKIDKAYIFDTPDESKSLADLFGPRSQLMIYHFMLAQDWQAGCHGCSFVADHFDGALTHLEHHDVTLVAVSRAPLAEIEAYKRRMGWHFPWVSSFDSDFNYDFHVSFRKGDLAKGKITYNFAEIDSEGVGDEQPGMSAFTKDEAGNVFHTYSTYTRGLEELIGTLMILDRAPLGRNEETTMDFVRRHDEYE